MKILEQVSLAGYSTMLLGGTAAFACEVDSKADLVEAVRWAKERQVVYRVIGSGSNIIWRDEGFDGLLIINQIQHFELSAQLDNTVYLTVGGGENWDSVVARSVEAGLSGIEALSLIPGTCGATPVQNVGAYGQEVSQTLVHVEAYDSVNSEFVLIPNAECGFGYRSSRFKTADKGRFLITEVRFRLTKNNPQPPFYPPVTAYLAELGLEPTTATIRQAVITIRSAKLPDPAVIGNTGSFFANPIITADHFASLQAKYHDIPHWIIDSGVKVSGAWLIERAGFKNYHDDATGMATWGNQPLVIVNESAHSTAALLQFKQKIVTAVEAMFGIRLEQEPELLP